MRESTGQEGSRKDRQVFGVKTSNFNFTGAIKIDMQHGGDGKSSFNRTKVSDFVQIKNEMAQTNL